MEYFIVGAVTGMLFGFFVGGLIYSIHNKVLVSEAIRDEQQKAVKAKVGGWVISEDTGESKFLYVNPTDLEN